MSTTRIAQSILIISLMAFLSPSAARANCLIQGATTVAAGTIEYDVYGESKYWSCDGARWKSLKYEYSVSNETSVYDQDFESGITSDEWGSDVSDSLSEYLGFFPSIGVSQGPNKTFTLSGSQDTTQISFDLYELNRFSGNFYVFIDDTQVISRNFSPNVYETSMSGSSGNVAWTATTLSSISFDFSGSGGPDNRHRFVLTITNPGDTSIKVGFGASSGPWGIDNAEVVETTGGSDTTIYSQDFESGTTSGEWGGTYSYGLTTCLGRYSESGAGQIAFKEFTLSGSQDSTDITLDLYELDTWDGEQFQVYLDDTLVFNESFSGETYNAGTSGSSGSTSWTLSNISPYLTDLGGRNSADQTYLLDLNIANPGATTLKVGFSDTLNQDVGDEAWCADYISVVENVGAGTTTVYDEDFEGSIAVDEWGVNTDITLGGFLGRFAGTGGSQEPNKTFTLPGTQSSTTISFDVYELDDWDGEEFRVFIDDTQVISQTFNEGTFDTPSSGSSGSVSWTATNVTEALEDLNFGSANDQVYNYVLTISNASASSIKLGFGSTLDEAVPNESWGVDNILVEETTSGSTTTVSSEDFQTVDSLDSWTNAPSAENSGTIFSQFLGRFSGTGGSQGLNRTFSLSGAQDSTTFVFDFYEIDSWDTEDFRLFINDSQIFSHSFVSGSYDSPSGGTNGNVTWSVENLTPDNFQMGFGFWNDQMYRYTVTVTNPSDTTAKIGFGATTTSAISDESWGIDNVHVYETAGGSDTTVYIDNFESGASGWSSNSTDSSYGNQIAIDRTRTFTASDVNIDFNGTSESATVYTYSPSRTEATTALLGGTVLGRYSALGLGPVAEKTFALSGSQDFTVLEFDAIEADTWDNEVLAVYINDVEIFTQQMNASSFDAGSTGSMGNVSWTSYNVTSTNTDLGFGGSNDQVYRYRVLIDNSGDTSLKVAFGTNLSSGSSDEALAIDNVKVTSAEATSVSPLTTCTASDEADMYYDTGSSTFVYCDGSNVWRMSSPAAAVGAACTTEGAMDFNTSSNTYEFCNGSNWIEMNNL